MFKWVRKSKATIGQLIEQLQAATREAAAAESAVNAAVEAFDAAGDDKAAKAVVTAREGHQLAVEHVGRARRLLPHRVGELASELIGKYQAEQARLQGPVTDELQQRIAAAAEKVQQLQAELTSARAAQEAVEAELRAVGNHVDRHAAAIQQVERRRDDALACDVRDPLALRRLKLAGELLEQQLGGE